MKQSLLTMGTLIRRELWEHKALWLAPAVTALLLWVALMWGMVSLISDGDALEMFNQNAVADLRGEQGYQFAYAMMRASIALLYLVMLVVLFFYALDSLYAERRDRSILFWRSLPVSDTVTVASKALTAIVVAPLIVIAIVLGLELLDVLITKPLLAIVSDLGYWESLHLSAVMRGVVESLWDMWLLGLWYLPFFGWLFLASAWARRSAFLWAVLPPLGLGLAEYLIFRSREFFILIGEHFARPFKDLVDGYFGFQIRPGDDVSQIQGGALELTGLSGMATPAFWIGLAIGFAMLAAAVAIRRYRGETV